MSVGAAAPSGQAEPIRLSWTKMSVVRDGLSNHGADFPAAS